MTELRGKGGALIAEETPVAIDFEGAALSGRRGETLAAALSAAGIRELRLTRRGEPRGIFCGMGVCQECLVEIDGRANQRAALSAQLRHLIPAHYASLTGPRAAESNGRRKRKAG